MWCIGRAHLKGTDAVLSHAALFSLQHAQVPNHLVTAWTSEQPLTGQTAEASTRHR